MTASIPAPARRALRSPRTLPLFPAQPEASPIVKWAGGKGRLLASIRPLLPTTYGRYLEPFVGGGALFFSLQPRRALLADLNPELVNTYEVVRDHVEPLIERLAELRARHGHTAYYDARTRYNARVEMPLPTLERASLFIYLNKTCYNGLYRVNRQNRFNVPMGRYDDPAVCDADGLRRASKALAMAELSVGSFETTMGQAEGGDLVYLDPPYAPLSVTANFTSYTDLAFDDRCQRQLAERFAELDRKGCLLVLSNSDTPLVRSLYARYDLMTVMAHRAINSKATARAPIPELVIRNF